MMIKKWIFLLLVGFGYIPYLWAQDNTLFFLDKEWVVEDESGRAQILNYKDTLELVAPQGLTLWYNELLKGTYHISYKIYVVDDGGEYDRVSDVNCFWSGNDPLYSNDFWVRSTWRKGIFKNYNSLNLFYVGYGGNDNTTTRFRRYYGKYFGIEDNKIKPILAEYTDTAHLLVSNRWYEIEISINQNSTSFYVNGKEIFMTLFSDAENGYFGLRLFKNHVLFTDFRVMIFGNDYT